MEVLAGAAGQALRAGQTSLALRLAKHLVSGDTRNLVFSPLSIHASLALVAAGARGATLDQLLGFLGAASADDLAAFVGRVTEHVLADRSGTGGPCVTFGSGIWVDASLGALKPAFREAAAASCKAEAFTVDFRNKREEARNLINTWAEHATKGLIKSALPALPAHEEITLVLANALYFKGEWREPFNKARTRDAEFYLLDGGSINVPFMSAKIDKLISSYDGFKVLKLPYKQEASQHNIMYSMCIFLPDAHDGIWSVLDKMTSDTEFLHRHLPNQSVPVGDFRVPKFKITSCFGVSRVLQDMGLVSVFRPGADLSGVFEANDDDDDHSGRPSTFVNDVHHNAAVDVDERGTEAAAVTRVLRRTSARWPRPALVDFVADHPFVFVILEEVSGIVMFMGHVPNPAME